MSGNTAVHEMLTVRETLTKFDISRTRLYRLISDGRVFIEKAGRRTLLRATDVRKHLDADKLDYAMPPRQRYECHLFSYFLLSERYTQTCKEIEAETDFSHKNIAKLFNDIIGRAAQSEHSSAKKWQSKALAGMTRPEADAYLGKIETEMRSRAVNSGQNLKKERPLERPSQA